MLKTLNTLKTLKTSNVFAAILGAKIIDSTLNHDYNGLTITMNDSSISVPFPLPHVISTGFSVGILGAWAIPFYLGHRGLHYSGLGNKILLGALNDGVTRGIFTKEGDVYKYKINK
jgi:hypothetical protein